MLIPKVFHQIWLGTNPIPDEFLQYRETWRTLHPGWEIKVWTDENVPSLLNQGLFDASKGTAHIVKCVDILKLDLIVQFGGIFIDCDFECFKCIEPLIENMDAFSAGETEDIFGDAIMGCVPGHAGFTKFLQEMPGWVARHTHTGINVQTGPFFYTNVRKEHPELQTIKVFGPELFYPYLYYEKHRKHEHFPNAYAAHHWAGSWTNWKPQKS